MVLKESGIRYPDGFDPNTVGEVRGRAFGFSRPERGPVRFRLKSNRETYIVLASPAWFWKDIGADFREGAQVRVRGSKSLGKDGNLYIVAQEMRLMASDRPLVFRSGDGFPLWKGPISGATGNPGPKGVFGPSGGGGGMGGGFGGMERRHR